jgi:hypothetical protein
MVRSTVRRVLMLVALAITAASLVTVGCAPKGGKPREPLPVKNVDNSTIDKAGEANKGAKPDPAAAGAKGSQK